LCLCSCNGYFLSFFQRKERLQNPLHSFDSIMT
jgi:hypothetical protein